MLFSTPFNISLIAILPALFAEPHDWGTRVWIHSPTIAERINIGGKLDDYLKLNLSDMSRMSGIKQSYINSKFAETNYLKYLHYSQLIGIKYFHDKQDYINN